MTKVYIIKLKSKYEKNATYYIAFEDELNTKYAVTLK